MNIYDEAIESIEGLPHTIKVPLRRVLKRAKKVEELLGLYRKQSNLLWDEDFVSATPVKWEIDDLEKALEEELK